MSTRARVGTGDKVLIGGVIVRAARRKILFRALGPSLAAQLTGTLLDPELELHDANGVLITSNDNWPDAPNRDEIIASTLSPTDTRESVIFVATPPGNYTAIVRRRPKEYPRWVRPPPMERLPPSLDSGSKSAV